MSSSQNRGYDLLYIQSAIFSVYVRTRSSGGVAAQLRNKGYSKRAMDQEERDGVSAHYSIHTDAENGRRDSDGEGFEWRSTVSNRSVLSRRSFAIGKQKLSSCKALFLVAFIGVAVALMSLPAVIHPFLVCNLLLSMK